MGGAGVEANSASLLQLTPHRGGDRVVKSEGHGGED